jgi:hypothetical protein
MEVDRPPGVPMRRLEHDAKVGVIATLVPLAPVPVAPVPLVPVPIATCHSQCRLTSVMFAHDSNATCMSMATMKQEDHEVMISRKRQVVGLAEESWPHKKWVVRREIGGSGSGSVIW